MRLAPFWRYYGGKNRSARLYPQPEHDTIIEPFAGAAGYSCRYPDKKIVLVDKSPVIVGVWRYLIAASEQEILQLPDVPDGGTVDDLSVCQEARWLIGFWLSTGSATPKKSPSARARRDGMSATHWSGWGYKPRNRIAEQVKMIRHWTVVEGDYTDAPNIEATWFIDPPYNNKAGSYYPQQPDNFQELGMWCQERKGLVMVCENTGADWLPFKHLAETKSNEGEKGKGKSSEVVWFNRQPRTCWGKQKGLFQ